MTIQTIVYRSAPVFSGSVHDYIREIDAILATARRRNAEASITGALLFNEDWFVQLLEGEKTAVCATFKRIAADPRHGEVQILFDGVTAERRLPEWSMAFVGYAAAIRKRFADSPFAKPEITMHGEEVINFMVALATDHRPAG